MELGYKYFINQQIFKKIIIINIIIFLLPLVSNTFLFLFDFNQISIVKYFDLHPELNQVLMSPWTILEGHLPTQKNMFFRCCLGTVFFTFFGIC